MFGTEELKDVAVWNLVDGKWRANIHPWMEGWLRTYPWTPSDWKSMGVIIKKSWGSYVGAIEYDVLIDNKTYRYMCENSHCFTYELHPASFILPAHRKSFWSRFGSSLDSVRWIFRFGSWILKLVRELV